MEPDRHKFLSFWTTFGPFIPLTTEKMEISLKVIKSLSLVWLVKALHAESEGSRFKPHYAPSSTYVTVIGSMLATGQQNG